MKAPENTLANTTSPATDPNASVWDMPVPDGYVRDSRGRLVHESTISDADALRNRTVIDLVARAITEAARVGDFFDRAHDELKSFCALSAERFGVRWGETDSFTMTSLCGCFKLQADVDQGVAINESVGAAKTLLDECLADWSAGGKPQAVALLANTFRPTRNGRLSLTRLFDLLRNRNLPEFINEEKFQRLCDALEAAIQTTTQRRYLRFYARRTPADAWQMVKFGK